MWAVLRFALRGLVLACSLLDVTASARLVRGYAHVGKDCAFALRGTVLLKAGQIVRELDSPQFQFIDRLLIFHLCHRDDRA